MHTGSEATEVGCCAKGSCGRGGALGALLLLAPRIVPKHPYERGLGDFGQSMGMTVTGLLLMRIADPSGPDKDAPHPAAAT